MKSNLLTLTATQLRRAADIKDEIASLSGTLAGIFNQDIAVVPEAPAKVKTGRRSMSNVARMKIARAAKLRWKKAKAAGRSTL